ncbi:uncharacterized protein EV420DRAFT_1706619 [Desarmillaria tabescens]|uniref:C2H2-type domain-containing protein n=1 Tax=Armillaria tabescens TaxID=1929756 RepID=A0AA39MXH7_ARMTA|nr:uncharacterized protein EV420DRAFT_1706619 [Desarmillaria tabescens]KAK0449704.1 hypothetical protein EV420DRAFT_1706619 [Desarmillaria tabescens]
MARWNVRTRCPLSSCTKTTSRDADIERHLKTHKRDKEDILHCGKCPFTTLQSSNLEKHRKGHHSGKEKYKCSDPCCTFGANTQGAITAHQNRFHKGVTASTWDTVITFEKPAHELESTVPLESSGSSPSYTSDSLATNINETRLEDSSFPNPPPLDIGPAPLTVSAYSQAVSTDAEQFRSTPSASGLQHDDKHILPEAKILYPAVKAGPPLDIESDPIFSQGECFPAGVDDSFGAVSSSHTGIIDDGSIVDVPAISNTFNVPTPVHVPANSLGYQQDPQQVYSAPLPRSIPAYSCPGLVDSMMNANTLNTPFPAYNAAGPSGYQYQPELVTTAPLQYSVPSGIYPESYQTYQAASWNALNTGMPQPVNNALSAVQNQQYWMPTSSVQPSPNYISEYAFPVYASEHFSDGVYEGIQYR